MIALQARSGRTEWGVFGGTMATEPASEPPAPPRQWLPGQHVCRIDKWHTLSLQVTPPGDH
jgi:hypothetical protein